MVTITDISEKLGVSPATVSRALNRSRLVKPELEKEIRRVASDLGYEKREIRRHRGRGILNIKLVLPHHSEPERALFYDLASLIEGIRSGFKHCAINLLCETASPHFKPFPNKKGGDIDGFVFAFQHPAAAILEELSEFGTPFAILNRDIAGLPCVASENAAGMELLVEHLRTRKTSLEPAYLSLEGLGQIDEERLNGLVRSCESRGIDFDSSKDVLYFKNIRSIKADALAPLAKTCNALICTNDIIATVVLHELDRIGVSVPGQVAVTGFDDSPVRQLSRPLLTTIAMPLHSLAESAASRLESRIIDHVAHPDSTLRVSGKLIIGEST